MPTLPAGRSALGVLSLILIMALGPAPVLAHGGVAVVNKSGWITLGPSGNVTDVYHQFGFILALGDSLDIAYNVSQGSSDLVDFQLHVHLGNLTKVFLNVTQGIYRTVFNITLDGFYMPQWSNPNPHAVGLMYSISTVHPGAATPFYLQAPFFIIAGAAVGLGCAGPWLLRRRRERRSPPNPPPLPPSAPPGA